MTNCIDTAASECKIREFLSSELAHDWGKSISLDEPFTLDSLDQIDLRLFLEETFAFKPTQEQAPFKTINEILLAITPLN